MVQCIRDFGDFGIDGRLVDKGLVIAFGFVGVSRGDDAEALLDACARVSPLARCIRAVVC